MPTHPFACKRRPQRRGHLRFNFSADGYAQLPPPDQQQQQQLEAAEEQQLEAAVEDDGSAPLARLLELPQLQPAAFRVYDFREKSWVRHNITQVRAGGWQGEERGAGETGSRWGCRLRGMPTPPQTAADAA